MNHDLEGQGSDAHPFFPMLFKPWSCGALQLKNRVIMGAMHVGLEDARDLKPLAAFYRARADAGLIVTGGFAPNRTGRLTPFAAKLTHRQEMRRHSDVTNAVHDAGGKIALQILHAGRYAYHPWSVAPSRLRSPIGPFTPWAMTRRCVLNTIRDFVRCARLAVEAGYDGLEIMGSEGYLIHEFLVQRTNHRQDDFGGSLKNRMRFSMDIMQAIREQVPSSCILIYRLSMLDLVPEGAIWDDIVTLGQRLSTAGVNILNTGIGWHESRIPTIAAVVPPAMFSTVTARMRQHVNIPVIASNRITTPELAEHLLKEGVADFISMARPFLADPAWVTKAALGQTKHINLCIACNQACLDQVFQGRPASCLVNPFAGREHVWISKPAIQKKRIAVVGGGPAGLAFAATAAKRGHEIVLFEASATLGGQFNLAQKIPGKAVFQDTVNYFKLALEALHVTVRLGHRATVKDVLDFDEIVLATGVVPRIPDIQGVNHPKVMTYLEALQGVKIPGRTVAVVGAGGIGFDVAAWLVAPKMQTPLAFCQMHGIDLTVEAPGGLVEPQVPTPERRVYLLQRKTEKMGQRLGKTTGWIHRLYLKKYQVEMKTGVQYLRIDDDGLHIEHKKQQICLHVDAIILCTGQHEQITLYTELEGRHPNVHRVGGAARALELDARDAIEKATALALKI